jgi:predicted 2-oxoglutarate/Fe(II)-dependent dioxygenase YbiX/peroxiredoxin
MTPVLPRAPEVGELAPTFSAPTEGVAAYSLDVVAGRYVVLMAFGSLGAPACAAALDAALARRHLFDDREALFFGVSADRADRLQRGLRNLAPGVRFFEDYDLAVLRLYGLVRGEALQPAVFLLDRMLRVMAAEPIEATGAVLDRLEAALACDAARPDDGFAPVLMAPRILEPELCAALIAYYEAQGGVESGFAVALDGRTVTRVDARFKRRRDADILDPTLREAVRARLRERLLPLMARAWGWTGREIERDLIACYDAADGGFFSAHRDDVTPGTAHRQFAVTLNLNAEAYEGGELRFPEFGRRTYKPPSGGAVVFGCNLLHEVTPVTAGVRYALAPFLYDEAGAAVRQAYLERTGQSRAAAPRSAAFALT